MSSEDRRRLSREMMDRIDAVVSGHDLQRSSEGGMHVDDGPLEFGDRTVPPGVDVRPSPPEDAAPEANPPRYATMVETGRIVRTPGGWAPLRFENDVHEGPPPDRAFRIAPDGRFSGYMSTRPHGFLTAAVRHAEAEDRVAETERARERYCRNPDCSGVVSFRTSAVTVTLPSGETIAGAQIERFGLSVGRAARGITVTARLWGRSIAGRFAAANEQLYRMLFPGHARPLPPVPFKRSKHRYGR